MVLIYLDMANDQISIIERSNNNWIRIQLN